MATLALQEAVTGGRGDRRTTSEYDDVAIETKIIGWLKDHPVPSVPGRCAWCGARRAARSVVLPFGSEAEAHTWLHAGCWPAWHQARRAIAAAAVRITPADTVLSGSASFDTCTLLISAPRFSSPLTVPARVQCRVCAENCYLSRPSERSTVFAGVMRNAAAAMALRD